MGREWEVRLGRAGGVGVRGDPDYPYINPLRIHDPPPIPTDRDKPCPYIKQKNRSPFGKCGKYGKCVTTGPPVL